MSEIVEPYSSKSTNIDYRRMKPEAILKRLEIINKDLSYTDKLEFISTMFKEEDDEISKYKISDLLLINALNDDSRWLQAKIPVINIILNILDDYYKNGEVKGYMYNQQLQQILVIEEMVDEYYWEIETSAIQANKQLIVEHKLSNVLLIDILPILYNILGFVDTVLVIRYSLYLLRD